MSGLKKLLSVNQHRDNGIDMDASEFSTVTINQSVPNNFDLLPLVQSSSIVGVSSQNENGAVSAGSIHFCQIDFFRQPT